MKKIKENKLTFAAWISLAVSILSVFTTIIGYGEFGLKTIHFTVFDFFGKRGPKFRFLVLQKYRGPVLWRFDMGTVRVLSIIGILALVFAIIGLSLISKQKESATSFVMALIGLIGTMIPSVMILFCVIFLGRYYAPATIYCGIYPILSPIAMIVCIIATTQMHRKNLEYKKKLREADGLLFRGTDLQ